MNRKMTSRFISLFLSPLLITPQIQAIDVSYAPHLKPSKISIDALKHKKGNSPKIKKANNGVPIVEIANANQAGISNNYFTDFNVDQKGLIFNNSKDLFTHTTLAGYINGNSNLTKEADLILNQVTGSETSLLAGTMEIAGKRADLIIANPNGLTCSGCGVLNAKTFTLATGSISQEEINRANSIHQTLKMMTQKGHINIQALNASNVKKLNLIAQSASIEGDLYAQDLQIILGKNEISFDLNDKNDASLLLYKPIEVTNQKGEKQTRLALDVGYLGSVVANSIYLVATEEGVGVKNSGNMASIGSQTEGDGGFVIHTNGTITISLPKDGESTLDKKNLVPSITSNTHLIIKAKNLHNQSILSAKEDIFITAQEVKNQSRYRIKKDLSRWDGYSWESSWFNRKVYEEWTLQDQIQSFSPAMIVGKNLTITADQIHNDMAHLSAEQEANFKTQKSFNNQAPQLKKLVYKHIFEYGLFLKTTTRVVTTDSSFIQGNLPQYNLQDLILSYTDAIFSNALQKINTFNYSAENREQYTQLNAFLRSSSFQEHAKKQTLQTILKNLAQISGQEENKKRIIRNANTGSMMQERLKRRMLENQTLRGLIQGYSAMGIQAENLIIQAQEITNTSLAEAGYIALIGENILNENGIIASATDLNIHTKDFSNRGGDLMAKNNLSIQADSIQIGTLAYNITGKLEGRHNKVSNLNAKNISLYSKEDTHLTSVNFQAEKALNISGNNVLLDTAQNIQTTLETEDSWRLKFFSVVKKEKNRTTQTSTNIANSLKANDISIQARNNLVAYNLAASARENLSLSAQNNIKLSTKKDTIHISDKTTETNIGFHIISDADPIRVGIGLYFSHAKTDINLDTRIGTHNNQTLKAQNISIYAKNEAKLESINTDSKNLSIKAQDVTISALSDSYSQDISRKDFFIGGGIRIGFNYRAFKPELGVIGRAIDSTSNSTLYQTSTSSANLKANHLSITALDTNANAFTPKKNRRGDINIIGSNLVGENIALQGERVKIKTHKTEYKSTYSNEGKEIYAGSGIRGLIVPSIGMETNYQISQSFQAQQGVKHTASNLSGKDIIIQSKQDTNIIGSKISATRNAEISARNVLVLGSIDTNMEYGYQYKVRVNGFIGFSPIFMAEADGFANAKGGGSISTHVNNASINAENLKITTKKGWLDPLNGNLHLIGANLNAKNINADIKGDLNIGSIQSHSLKAQLNARAETFSPIHASWLLQTLEFNSHINLGYEAKIKDQAGIKGDQVKIKTGRNTSFMNAYISAKDPSSSIQSNTLTKLDLKDVEANLSRTDHALSAMPGVVSGFLTGDYKKIISDFKRKDYQSALNRINNLFFAGTQGYVQSFQASTTPRPSTISKEIDLMVKNPSKASQSILRGEPIANPSPSWSIMQTKVGSKKYLGSYGNFEAYGRIW